MLATPAHDTHTHQHRRDVLHHLSRKVLHANTAVANDILHPAEGVEAKGSEEEVVVASRQNIMRRIARKARPLSRFANPDENTNPQPVQAKIPVHHPPVPPAMSRVLRPIPSGTMGLSVAGFEDIPAIPSSQTRTNTPAAPLALPTKCPRRSPTTLTAVPAHPAISVSHPSLASIKPLTASESRAILSLSSVQSSIAALSAAPLLVLSDERATPREEIDVVSSYMVALARNTNKPPVPDFVKTTTVTQTVQSATSTTTISTKLSQTTITTGNASPSRKPIRTDLPRRETYHVVRELGPDTPDEAILRVCRRKSYQVPSTQFEHGSDTTPLW
ncbi:hypothetical protein MKEN_00041800 [Mycena kentingensis (nom. inval.)]|nr:hypothetical protein MKEN_00041800 [Mycena kentingensis (nom. inval.)]